MIPIEEQTVDLVRLQRLVDKIRSDIQSRPLTCLRKDYAGAFSDAAVAEIGATIAQCIGSPVSMPTNDALTAEERAMKGEWAEFRAAIEAVPHRVDCPKCPSAKVPTGDERCVCERKTALEKLDAMELKLKAAAFRFSEIFDT